MVSWITSNGAGDVRQKSNEQRRWGRTICFVKIVNGAGATSVFFLVVRKHGRGQKFAVDKSTHMSKSLKSPQTYDNAHASIYNSRRKIHEVLEVNFGQHVKKLKLYWFYRCFWVFEQLEKNERNQDYIGFTNGFWVFFAVKFEVKILCAFRNR